MTLPPEFLTVETAIMLAFWTLILYKINNYFVTHAEAKLLWSAGMAHLSCTTFQPLLSGLICCSLFLSAHFIPSQPLFLSVHSSSHQCHWVWVLSCFVHYIACARLMIQGQIDITQRQLMLDSLSLIPTSSFWSLSVCKYGGRRPGKFGHVRLCQVDGG